MSVPPAAVLGGLLIITSFVMSPAIVKVPGTNWVEPVLVWLTISMPTGSSKTTIYQFLQEILHSLLCYPMQRSVIIACVYLSCAYVPVHAIDLALGTEVLSCTCYHWNNNLKPSYSILIHMHTHTKC